MRNLFILLFIFCIVSCGENESDGTLQGYAEGRQLNLAPRSIGILTTLNVSEGDQVITGAMLFAVDS